MPTSPSTPARVLPRRFISLHVAADWKSPFRALAVLAVGLVLLAVIGAPLGALAYHFSEALSGVPGWLFIPVVLACLVPPLYLTAKLANWAFPQPVPALLDLEGTQLRYRQPRDPDDHSSIDFEEVRIENRGIALRRRHGDWIDLKTAEGEVLTLARFYSARPGEPDGLLLPDGTRIATIWFLEVKEGKLVLERHEPGPEGIIAVLETVTTEPGDPARISVSDRR